MVVFSILNDKELVAKGSHFFCLGHCCAVEIEERSADPDYCHQCLKVLRKERRASVSGRWSGDEFLVGDKKFTIGNNGNGDVPAKPSTRARRKVLQRGKTRSKVLRRRGV